MTLVLLLGQVLPLMMLLHFTAHFALLVFFQDNNFESMLRSYQTSGMGIGFAFATLGTFAMYYPRIDAALRYRLSMESALMHPLGIVVLLALQWYAAFRSLFNRPAQWKGRAYPL